MSDGPPEDPTQRPMPWDAQPPDGNVNPPEPPPAEPQAPESAPTEVTPTPLTPDAAPPAQQPVDPAQPGLISAAPVGWGAAQAPGPSGPPAAGGWGAAQAPGPSGQPGAGSPPVGWAPAPQAAEVPGAPGLTFADTVSRFVAYFIDAIILGVVGSILAAALGFGRATTIESGTGVSYAMTSSSAAFTIPFTLLGLVYFVFFWTGGRRATLGQRVFHLQVGNAFDGRDLTLEQAVRRWLALGSFLGLFALIPGVAGIASLVELVWVIALLITTATSPTKQGLHDRFANTAVVRPAGQGTSGWAVACIVIAGVLLLLFIFSIVALIFVGSQVSTILSAVGESI